MKNLRCVLLLNSDVQPLSLVPLSIITWQDAIKNIFLGRFSVLETYDAFLRSPKREIPVPAVVMLNNYFYKQRGVRFCKSNVFLRDDYTCQYCGKFYYHEQEKLTYDHVIPKSKGGRTKWENIITSCMKCNVEKKDELRDPIRMPYSPTYYQLAEKRKNYPVIVTHESWNSYLLWEEDKVVFKKLKGLND